MSGNNGIKICETKKFKLSYMKNERLKILLSERNFWTTLEPILYFSQKQKRLEINRKIAVIHLFTSLIRCYTKIIKGKM